MVRFAVLCGFFSHSVVINQQLNSAQSSTARFAFDAFIKTVRILVAWMGFRADVGLSMPVAAAQLAVVVCIQLVGLLLPLVEREHRINIATMFIVWGWAYYYIGHSLLIAFERDALIKRLGEQRAWRTYVVVLGTMFGSQGLCRDATDTHESIITN